MELTYTDPSWRQPGFAGLVAEPNLEGPAAEEPSLITETPSATLRRIVLGFLAMAKPKRAKTIPAFVLVMVREMISGGRRVPQRLLKMEDIWTFGGIARNVTTDDLIAAHRRGFSVLCHVPPLKWWMHDPRAILLLEDARVPKRLRSTMRKTDITISFDTAFGDVLNGCAKPRPGQTPLTWITPQIGHLYRDLHNQGYAHSIEAWDGDGNLIGGLFGVGVGRIFVVRSMFYLEPNASKLALLSLHHHLAKWGFRAVDYQGMNPMIEKLGYETWDRADYDALMAEHATKDDFARQWTIEDDLSVVADGPPQPPMDTDFVTEFCVNAIHTIERRTRAGLGAGAGTRPAPVEVPERKAVGA